MIATMLVPAGDVRVGDRVVLPFLGPREVLSVERYDEPTGREPGPRVLIVYRVVGGGVSFENKATAHGRSEYEAEAQALRPLQLNDWVTIERHVDDDELADADELRADDADAG